jgi:uncharacterized protein (DUF885 family)
VAEQNKLFDQFYETGLKNSPERATSFGDYRYNSLLSQASLAEIARQHAEADDFLKRLKAIPTDGMDDKDLLSHRLLERQLEREDTNYDLKNYEMPVNQQRGVHTGLADLPLPVPFDSVQHYQDYISRLHQIPRAGSDHRGPPPGHEGRTHAAEASPRKLPGQCDGIVAANPFLLPTKKFPKEFSDADKKRLTDEMTKAINDDVVPAYKKFTEFLRTEYDPKGRPELSIETLPDGKRRYAEAVKMMTTMSVTPEEVHQIGLKEVERITAEMTKLAQAQGHKDLASFRQEIHDDTKWTPKSEQQIVDDFAKYIHQMEPELRSCRPAPEVARDRRAHSRFRESRSHALRSRHTGWQAAWPRRRGGGRSNQALLVNNEAVAYHEGVPGHHMQISIAQTLQGIPKFRLRGVLFHAEGWALSEGLAKRSASTKTLFRLWPAEL